MNIVITNLEQGDKQSSAIIEMLSKYGANFSVVADLPQIQKIGDGWVIIDGQTYINEKPSEARQWLKEFIKEPFDRIEFDGTIIYGRGDDWFFEIDSENEYIYIRQSIVLDNLDCIGLDDFAQTESSNDIIRDVVCAPLGCTNYTIRSSNSTRSMNNHLGVRIKNVPLLAGRKPWKERDEK